VKDSIGSDDPSSPGSHFSVPAYIFKGRPTAPWCIKRVTPSPPRVQRENPNANDANANEEEDIVRRDGPGRKRQRSESLVESERRMATTETRRSKRLRALNVDDSISEPSPFSTPPTALKREARVAPTRDTGSSSLLRSLNQNLGISAKGLAAYATECAETDHVEAQRRQDAARRTFEEPVAKAQANSAANNPCCH
jgi:hypothetical protein